MKIFLSQIYQSMCFILHIAISSEIELGARANFDQVEKESIYSFEIMNPVEIPTIIQIRIATGNCTFCLIKAGKPICNMANGAINISDIETNENWTFYHKLTPGQYEIHLKLQNTSLKMTGWMQIDNALELMDHSQSKFASHANGFVNLLFVSCATHNDYGTPKLTINVSLGGEPTTVSYFFTNQHKYPTAANCDNDTTNEICNISNVQDLLLTPGRIYRITVFYSKPGNYTIEAHYAPYHSHSANGLAQNIFIPKSKQCQTYFVMDFKQVFDYDVFVNYAISANHKQPWKEGQLTLTTSPFSNFSQSVEVGLDGTLVIPQRSLEVYGCRAGEQCLIYLKINQKTGLDYSSIDSDIFKSFTDGDFVVGQNLDFAQQGVINNIVMTPMKSSETDPATIEWATKRYAINFETDFPWIELTNISVSKTINLSMSYAFCYFYDSTIQETDLVLNLFVDWASFPDQTKNGNSITNDEGNWHIAYSIVPTTWDTKSNESYFSVGETVFSASQLLYVKDKPTNVSNLYHLGGSVVQIPLHVKAVYTHQKVNQDTYYFGHTKLEGSEDKDKIIDAGGLYISVSVTSCQQGATLYVSKINPLPNFYTYLNKSRKGTNIDMLIEITDEDSDIYYGVYAAEQCDVTLTVHLINEVQTLVSEGVDYNESNIDANTTKQYVIAINGNIYGKQNSYFKFKRDTAASDAIGYQLQFALTYSPYLGSAWEAPAEAIVLQGSISQARGEIQLDRSFLNRGYNQLFLTVTRNSTDASVSKAAFRFQLGSVAKIGNDESKLQKFMSRSRAPVFYHLKPNIVDQFRFNISSTFKNYDVYICKYAVPFISQLNTPESLCTMLTLGSDNYYEVKVLDKFHAAGNSYIVIYPKVSSDSTVSVYLSLQLDRFVQFGAQDSVKIGGASSSYLAVPIGNQTGTFENVYAIVEKCNNCAMCLSFERHLVLTPKNISLCKPENNRFVIGNLAEEQELDPSKRTYQTKVSFRIPSGGKAQIVYATLVSLDVEGVSENVIFMIDRYRETTSDYLAESNIGWVDENIYAYDNETKTIYQSKMNYFVTFSCSTEHGDHANIEVNPNITGENSAIGYILAHYSVYASTTNPIPSEMDYNWSTTNMPGMSVLTIKTSDLFKQCSEEGRTMVFLYISVRAAPQMKDSGRKYFNTLTKFNMKAGSDVIRALRYGVENRLGSHNYQKRVLLHFNVITMPTQFVMSPCQGYPQMRAGVTNYYERSIGENETVNKQESVWSSYPLNRSWGQDIIFGISPGGKHMFLGDWILEILDNRESHDFIWNADIYVSNTDPRPGTPIRVTKVGSKGDQLQVEFRPAIPLGKNSKQDNVEYNFYILPEYKNLDSTSGYNPYTACGYMVGGQSLLDNWTNIGFDYNVRFTGDPKRFREFVDKSGTKYFSVAIIVRQIDTGMMRSYQHVEIDLNNMPPPLDSISNTSSTITIIVVSVVIGALLIAGAIILGIFLYRKKKAANPYQFAIEH